MLELRKWTLVIAKKRIFKDIWYHKALLLIEYVSLNKDLWYNLNYHEAEDWNPWEENKSGTEKGVILTLFWRQILATWNFLGNPPIIPDYA